jgi:NADH dehydrogenase FAD-containing subunit
LSESLEDALELQRALLTFAVVGAGPTGVEQGRYAAKVVRSSR